MTDPAPYKERFENLLRVLEQVQNTTESQIIFDMDTWYCARQMECNSYACAIGSCALDPWFQAQGFTLTTLIVTPSWQFSGPTFQGKVEWNAVGAFFGISQETAAFLFRSEYYDTPWSEGKEAVTIGLVLARIQDYYLRHYAE